MANNAASPIVSGSTEFGVSTPEILQIALNVTFFGVLLSTVLFFPQMFFKRHGRHHALLGLWHLRWLVIGFIQYSALTSLFDPLLQLLPWYLRVLHPRYVSPLTYDIVLGLSGTGLALTAAYEFKHKNVVNVASGTLDEHATVTYSEMIEHSFYQVLNLFQALFLHLLPLSYAYGAQHAMVIKVLLCVFVSLPWLARPWFPINKFSDNYEKVDEKSTSLIRFMYRVKKWQYVFYKHFLLHGLVLSAAFLSSSSDNHIAVTPEFRMYWLLLNTSYVMEFFLQTLVKKQYLHQQVMLQLQFVLMLSASVSALQVLFQYVNITVSLVSMALNFANRKQDFINSMMIVVALVSFAS